MCDNNKHNVGERPSAGILKNASCDLAHTGVVNHTLSITIIISDCFPQYPRHTTNSDLFNAATTPVRSRHLSALSWWKHGDQSLNRPRSVNVPPGFTLI